MSPELFVELWSAGCKAGKTLDVIASDITGSSDPSWEEQKQVANRASKLRRDIRLATGIVLPYAPRPQRHLGERYKRLGSIVAEILD
jgi:hypothetical protein